VTKSARALGYDWEDRDHEEDKLELHFVCRVYSLNVLFELEDSKREKLLGCKAHDIFYW